MKDQKKRMLVGNVKIYKGRGDAIQEFHSNLPFSVMETGDNEFACLYYKQGCNRGLVKFCKVEKQKEISSMHDGMVYWNWKITNEFLNFHTMEIKDFGVLLPKSDPENPRPVGEEWGEYTIVSKEWITSMLEHYDFSNVGTMIAKKEGMGEEMEEGWV